MYIGASLFLITAGAILAWAVDVDWESFDLNLAGLIVFGVGILGLLISFYTMRLKRKKIQAAAAQINAPQPGGPGAPGGPGGPGPV